MPVSPEIQEIAQIYEITIHIVPEYLLSPRRPDLPADVSTAFGNGLNVARREVYLFGDNNVESHLHEMMHIITHPAGCKLSVVRENWMLMQFERELARKMLPNSMFRRVVSWQRGTEASDNSELFANKREYWRDKGMWLDGRERAVEVGLLDKKGYPTFKYPTWPRDPFDMYSSWAAKYDANFSDVQELRE
jgi:hypothetical protein